MDSDLGSLETPETKESKELKTFEGHEVAFTKAKLTSAGDLEIDDQELNLDGTYRLFVEVKVTGVNYTPNRDGKLVRHHTMKVVDTQLIDWDDPNAWRQ